MHTTTHPAQVAQSNADARLLAGARFLVIERATGLPVGDGEPMPYAFAQHVCRVRDAFKTGAFFIRGV